MEQTLKQRRTELGKSKREIAEQLGVRTGCYGLWEANPARMPIEQAKKVCGALGVGMDDLFFGSNSTFGRKTKFAEIRHGHPLNQHKRKQ